MNITEADLAAQRKEQDLQFVLSWKFGVEGVGLPLVGILGLAGNILSLLVLVKSELDLKPMFRHLVICLLLFDIVCILSSILIFSIQLSSQYYRLQILPYLVPTLLPVAQIALTGSVYTSLTVSAERYLCVCRPYFRIPVHAGIFSSLSVLIFSFVVSINRFFEYEVEVNWTILPIDMNIDGVKTIGLAGNATHVNATWANPSPTDLRQHTTYSKVSTVGSVLVLNLIPFVLLVILNGCIYRTIQRRTKFLSKSSSREKRDFIVATVLLLIILVFLICHSIKCYINLVELWAVITGQTMENSWGPNKEVAVAFSHLLITTNCSSNFFIYLWKDNNFRSVFRSIICLRTTKVSNLKTCSGTYSHTDGHFSRLFSPSSILLHPHRQISNIETFNTNIEDESISSFNPIDQYEEETSFIKLPAVTVHSVHSKDSCDSLWNKSIKKNSGINDTLVTSV